MASECIERLIRYASKDAVQTVTHAVLLDFSTGKLLTRDILGLGDQATVAKADLIAPHLTSTCLFALLDRIHIQK